MNAPGSPSSALQMTILGEPDAFATVFHFRPVEYPAPPRPRRPLCVISSRTSAGVRVVQHVAQRLVAAVGDGVVEALGVDHARALGHDPDLAGEERRGLVALVARPGGRAGR